MKHKTTVQDIADSLNLSRATVSKVLNNASGVSDSTKQAVLVKIQELNYKNADRILINSPKSSKKHAHNFAFLMHSRPDDLHVGSTIMTQLEQEIRKEGYSLTIHTITDEDIKRTELPPNLYIDQTEAIVCLELFNDKYSQLLCSLNIPVLFVDACSIFYKLGLKCDLLMMENRSSVYQMLATICNRHSLKTMGYFGDNKHCLSFLERYEGFQLAALECEIMTDPYDIIDSDFLYSNPEWIEERIKKMEQLPQLFFCANDVLARNLILVLEKLGYQIPGDILICGFDGIPTQNPIINSLTTVRTPSTDLGIAAAQLLIQRIKNPNATYTSTYLRTDILYRGSTL